MRQRGTMGVVLSTVGELGQPPARTLLAKIPLAVLPEHVQVTDLLLAGDIVERKPILRTGALPVTVANLTYPYPNPGNL